MKTLTVRLPEPLVASIESESRDRAISKSDVGQGAVAGGRAAEARHGAFDTIADLVGSVQGLPRDLSSRKTGYLKSSGYGRKGSR